MIRAWHFTSDKLRDGSPLPPVGEWLEYRGKIVMCQSGLHASRDPFDALQYAPGPILHLVECDGIVEEQDDKLVCSRRRIIASKDATEGLRFFARMEALRVVPLWGATNVVLDYLMTGDKSLRDAAWEAAWAARAAGAARAAAREAAWAAAWEAAWAARAAAWAAAWEAAWAARAAERCAVRDEQRQFFNLLVNEAFEDYL